MADKYFLSFQNPVKFDLCIFKFQVGVSVQSHTDIRMPHDILQGFGIHTALSHVGTESMTAHMGCDLRKLNFVDTVVLVEDMLEVMLPVKGDHGLTILVQEKKSGVTVNHRFFLRLLPVTDDPLKALNNLLAHGNIAFTTFSLGFLDDVLHIPCALKLVIHPNPLFLKVNVRQSQTAEFRNPQSRVEQMKISS